MGSAILSFTPTTLHRASPAQSRFSGEFWGRMYLFLKHSVLEEADMATDGNHTVRWDWGPREEKLTVDRIMPSKDAQVLTPKPVAVTLSAKGLFMCDWVKALEIRLSYIICVGPRSSQGSLYEGGKRVRIRERNHDEGNRDQSDVGPQPRDAAASRSWRGSGRNVPW